MARIASKTAAPAAQTATEFPKITDKEMLLLKGVADSYYQDGDMIDKLVWSWSATNYLENKRGAGALVASLVKKGLLRHTPKSGDQDECIAFTKLGVEAYKAAQPAPVAAQPAKVAVEQVSEPVEVQAEPIQTEAPEVAEAAAEVQAEAPAQEQAPEAPAQDLQPVAVEAWVEAFKPKRINPAREALLIAMAEAPDGGAKVWTEQPKTRESTKVALLDGAFVKHDGKAAHITPKGRAFATYAALHQAQVNPAPKAAKAPKVNQVPKAAKAPADAPADVKPKHVSPKVTAADRLQSSSAQLRLSAIIHDVYGMNYMHAPVLALIWSASQMAELEGIANAKEALAEINKSRVEMGLAPALPPYGSKLF